VDEVGRGPLAGPVLAAAVVMSSAVAEHGFANGWSGLTDSKRLTAEERRRFCAEIEAHEGVHIGLGWVSSEQIDELNILYATYRAMSLALDALDLRADHALVDGNPVQGLGCPSTALVHGDACSFLIAAASVVAIVHRDEYMRKLDARHPGYDFASNKGYGTAAHVSALMRRGPCPEHRRSFRPVAESQQLRLLSQIPE
jgi:ribonuclease HII